MVGFLLPLLGGLAIPSILNIFKPQTTQEIQQKASNTLYIKIAIGSGILIAGIIAVAVIIKNIKK